LNLRATPPVSGVMQMRTIFTYVFDFIDKNLIFRKRRGIFAPLDAVRHRNKPQIQKGPP
jgi:hypothetical protein